MLATTIGNTRSAQVERRRFSAAEFLRMAQVGILKEDERVELIDGEICQMSPLDAAHTAVVKRLSRLLNVVLGDRYILGVQDPIQLHDFTEPQPDISILRWHDDFYEQGHPIPSDVLILIEVCNSSYLYDRNEKLPRYAAAGIPEVWLINLATRSVEQFTLPTNDTYANMSTFRRGSTLSSSTIPGFDMPVNQIFGL